MSMKIGIVGLGYVGLTLAGRCLQVGHEVVGFEINKAIKSSISKGVAHFYEPGLDDILKKGIDEGYLSLADADTSDLSLDVIIITVGTPLKQNTKAPNLGYISDAIRSVSHLIKKDNLVVLRSTVTVGLSRDSVLPLIQKNTGYNQDEINLSFCPERTLEGAAIHELANLPQIISGNTNAAIELAETFFTTVSKTVIRAESLEAAELVKLFNNVYRDINFSIGNLFNDIAMHLGIDGLKAIELANKDYKRSNIAKPGLVGGPCLEKDSYILCSNIDDVAISKVVLEARRYNENLEDKIVSWTMEKSSSRIIICGMAFKGIPDTNDLRGSNSVNIARRLHSFGRNIIMFDPICSYDELKELGFGSPCKELAELEVSSEDCVIILNNNKFFTTQNFTDSVNGAIILDVWNSLPLNEKYTLGNYKL